MSKKSLRLIEESGGITGDPHTIIQKQAQRIAELEAQRDSWGRQLLGCEQELEINMCITDENVLPLVAVCRVIQENPYDHTRWILELSNALQPFRE